MENPEREFAACINRQPDRITRPLTVSQAAAHLGVSQSFLNNTRRTPGAGPAFIKIGRAVRYLPADLDAFLLARRQDQVPAARAGVQ
jgi:hypothetical protein